MLINIYLNKILSLGLDDMLYEMYQFYLFWGWMLGSDADCCDGYLLYMIKGLNLMWEINLVWRICTYC